MKTRLFSTAMMALCGLSSFTFADDTSTEIFKNLDKNNDGILVADEIGEEQTRFFERLIRTGDANEDGKLSLGEYESTVNTEDKPVTGGGPQGPGDRPNPGEMFSRMDKNKDGKLTRDELPEPLKERMGAMFDRLGKEELTQEDMARAFAQMNRGNQPPGGRPEGDAQTLDFLKRMDANKDGKLSRDEIPEGAKERLGMMFDRIGKDELTFEEVMKIRRENERRESDRPKEEGKPEEGDRPREGERANMERPRDGEPRPPIDGRRPPAFMRVLDGDRDGLLSKEELANTEKLLAELDRNDDGKLSPPEMMGFEGDRGGPPPEGDRPNMDRPREGDRPNMDRPRPEGDRPRPEGDRPPQGREGFGPEGFLERFDTDKDGSITKEEAPERMAERFAEIDSNSDGKLSADELKTMMENFRGRPGGDRRPEGSSDRPKRPE